MHLRLDDYVDRYLSPEELSLVEAHLEECIRCARAYNFEVTLVREIKARLQRIQMPPHLLEAVRQRLEAEGADS